MNQVCEMTVGEELGGAVKAAKAMINDVRLACVVAETENCELLNAERRGLCMEAVQGVERCVQGASRRRERDNTVQERTNQIVHTEILMGELQALLSHRMSGDGYQVSVRLKIVRPIN